MIAATRAVTDRLDFISGLEEILFDKDLKKRTKERSQLHRILASETWIFREEYALTADDNTLKTALRAHVKLLGEDGVSIDSDDEVLDSEGRRVVVDLILSKVIEQHANRRDNIVIELKRPSKTIGMTEFTQIQNYAATVIRDDRFASTNANWEFWVIGDNIDDSVNLMVNQDGREPGIAVLAKNYTVRVLTWASVLSDAKHRLKFVQKALEYQSRQERGVEYLRETHGKYVADILRP